MTGPEKDALASAKRVVSEWELLVHTRQFSLEWQTPGLQDTELERVYGEWDLRFSFCLQERKRARRRDIEGVRRTAGWEGMGRRAASLSDKGRDLRSQRLWRADGRIVPD